MRSATPKPKLVMKTLWITEAQDKRLTRLKRKRAYKNKSGGYVVGKLIDAETERER